MFCSLLQEHLGSLHAGTFALGGLQHLGLAITVRSRVNERITRILRWPFVGDYNAVFVLLRSFLLRSSFWKSFTLFRPRVKDLRACGLQRTT
jgi:hypothetical protein